jgi:hypothetical protein
MLKRIKEMVIEKLGKDSRLTTFGISLAISFAISMIIGTISESHQAFAGGIPEPTHR